MLLVHTARQAQPLAQVVQLVRLAALVLLNAPAVPQVHIVLLVLDHVLLARQVLSALQARAPVVRVHQELM